MEMKMSNCLIPKNWIVQAGGCERHNHNSETSPRPLLFRWRSIYCLAPKQKQKVPVDLLIDLGKEEMLAGFRYCPTRNVWNPDIMLSMSFTFRLIMYNGNLSIRMNSPTSKTIHYGRPKVFHQ